MKKKDIISLVIALAVFAVVGLILYSKLGPKKKVGDNTDATVEIITPIKSDFDPNAIAELQNPSIAQNFSVPIDLSGLGNSQPFGPLK